ncbi:hypothetical protein M758_3G072800 [Ceratodon purpureus]|nr:hypothetical protein M758_3G072800 [Ceratodon purpureus]
MHKHLLTMSSNRSGEYDHGELLDERLRILLERLTWSYVALWTLNPRTRVFEWTRGCFNQALGGTKGSTTTSSSSPTVWDAQLFYTTYKSCSFAPCAGAVGRANFEGKNIWLTGDAVCQNAVSLEQSQFLRCSKIQTVMCIPWIDSVLEIGSTKLVGENFLLMDQIQEVLANDLLEPDPFENAPRNSGPTASDTTMFHQAQLHQESFHADHLTNLALQQPSSIGRKSPASNQRSAFQSEFSLSDQVWRSGNSSNLSLSSDIFMEESVIQLNSNMNRVKENLSFTLETGTPTSLQMPIGSTSPPTNWRSEINFRDSQQAVNQSHGLMVSQADQYTSWSGAAASSSVSSQRDSSARPSVSPDQLQPQIHASYSPNSRFSAHDRTSSLVRQRHSQLASPYARPASGTRNLNQIRRTTSCGDQHEVQKALSLFEAQEMQDEWRRQAQLHLNPASDLDVSKDVTMAKTLRSSSPQGRSPSPAQYNTSTNLPDIGQNNLQFQVWCQRDGAGSPDPTVQIQTNEPSNRPNPKRSSNASLMNQVSKAAGPLLRRQPAISEVLKEADGTYQKEAREGVSNDTYDLKVHQICEEPRPSFMQMNTGPNLRGRRRTVGVELAAGPVHAGHDEAAVNHMMAERRRRVKQKENFTALRRLVPIISKADKASTLLDAITYLKHLQNQIQELEASREDIDQRCESLENRCKKLEKRNQELVEILSKGDQPSGVVHLNQFLKLHSQRPI